MSTIRAEFGYYPRHLQVQAGPVRVVALPNLAQIVANLETNDGIEKGWIYSPPQQVQNLGGGTTTLPYPSRVFGLPKTHVIEHTAADGDDQVAFLLWALSFFTGMRLTATQAGFVDATPIEPGKLVDFVLTGIETALEVADAFWVANRATPERARLWSAAVHALFLGQSPRLLQFEKFILLYTALDACFALAKLLRPQRGRVTHADRVAWMCALFGMPVPVWADPATPAGPEVAALRNPTIHEALFMGEPLGFALHGVGTNQNITLEMEALICRLLVALIGGIGGTHEEYVRSPTNTRQHEALKLR